MQRLVNVKNLRLITDWAAIVLAVISGYILFLVIIPFFMLGIDKASYADIISNKVEYQDQLGILAFFGASYALLMKPLVSVLWLLSAINLGRQGDGTLLCCSRWHLYR